MKILLSFFVVASLLFSSFVSAASSTTADLEKQLQQKEDRIERLEQEVEYLRNQLLDLQYNASEERNAVDPLIGSWECTNTVFNYDISFFEDGRIVQEEPFLSKVRSGSWSRLDEDRFLIERGGPTFSTEFQSIDELIVTNPVNNVVWECFRKN